MRKESNLLRPAAEQVPDHASSVYSSTPRFEGNVMAGANIEARRA